jgi:hypothetical protein
MVVRSHWSAEMGSVAGGLFQWAVAPVNLGLVASLNLQLAELAATANKAVLSV